MKHIFSVIIFFTLGFLFLSCSNDPKPNSSNGDNTVKSSEKKIISFSFQETNPQFLGTIDEQSHKIKIVLSPTYDLTKLMPTITFSEKASLSPASGVQQNFSGAINYTVTAEDGSKQIYEVTAERVKNSNTGIDGIVYAGTLHGDFYAFDANNGTEIWTAKVDESINIFPKPAISNGIVYVSHGGNLVAFDAFTGAEKWRKSVSGNSPAISNGNVFQFDWNQIYSFNAVTGAVNTNFANGASKGGIYDNFGPFLKDGLMYARATETAIVAYDESGAQNWGTKFESGRVGALVLGNGMLYTTSDDGKFFSVDGKTGKQKWVINAFGKDCFASDGMVFYLSIDNKSVIILDADTGEKKTEYRFDNLIFASPYVKDGTLYVNDAPNLTAIDLKSGNKKWSIRADGYQAQQITIIDGIGFFKFSRVPAGKVSAEGYVGAIDIKTGELRWEVRNKEILGSPSILKKNGEIADFNNF